MGDDITLDDVKQRAQAARLTIRPERLEMVRRLLADALGPLRKMDARAMRTAEPATTFDARGGADDGRR